MFLRALSFGPSGVGLGLSALPIFRARSTICHLAIFLCVCLSAQLCKHILGNGGWQDSV